MLFILSVVAGDTLFSKGIQHLVKYSDAHTWDLCYNRQSVFCFYNIAVKPRQQVKETWIIF